MNPVALNDVDAKQFLYLNSQTPIIGDSAHNLQNYVITHSPSWGVLVSPATDGNRYLVWFDASNKLHVINVTGFGQADSISAPAYHTDDESFLYNVTQNISKMASGIGSILPSPESIGPMIAIALALYAVSVLKK